MRKGLITGLILAVVLSAASPGRGEFTELVVFGDSLSDSGNIFNASQNFFIALVIIVAFPELGDPPIPPPPYFEGRFSDGPVWVEALASRLALASPLPDLNSSLDSGNGSNFAVGGAKTNDPGELIAFDDVDEQVNRYLDSRTPTGNELFTVEGGANDLLGDSGLAPAAPAENLVAYVQQLYDAGGRHFAVPTLPPLGQIPGKRGGSEEAALDSRTVLFNSQLLSQLDAMRLALNDINIYPVDFAGLAQQIMGNSEAFGFANVTDSAIDPDTLQVDPNFNNDYLFWDDIHPSAKFHALLGEVAAAALLAPEITGDFSNDGTVDAADVDLLRHGIGASDNQLQFDVNGDFILDDNDFEAYLDSILATAAGDADLNRSVNFDDFVLLSNNFGLTETGWGQGNFDLNLLTNFDDFLILANSFGVTLPNGGQAPEPAAMAMMIALLLGRIRTSHLNWA